MIYLDEVVWWEGRDVNFLRFHKRVASLACDSRYFLLNGLKSIDFLEAGGMKVSLERTKTTLDLRWWIIVLRSVSIPSRIVVEVRHIVSKMFLRMEEVVMGDQ